MVTFAVRNAPDWGGAIAVIAKHLHHHPPMAAITIEPSDAAHEQRIVFRHPEATPGPNVDRRVRETVEQMISSNGAATVDDVSSMLHMRARTLQRRLAEEGTSFGKVCDGVRKHMAEVYLADDSVPLARVPDLLGYTNRSALNRSCTRWFGKTPLAMREQVTHAR